MAVYLVTNNPHHLKMTSFQDLRKNKHHKSRWGQLLSFLSKITLRLEVRWMWLDQFYRTHLTKWTRKKTKTCECRDNTLCLVSKTSKLCQVTCLAKWVVPLQAAFIILLKVRTRPNLSSSLISRNLMIWSLRRGKSRLTWLGVLWWSKATAKSQPRVFTGRFSIKTN